MATKKTRRKSKQRDDGISIVGVKKEKDLKPKAQTKRSKYDEIVDRAIRLRPGEVLEIAIDDSESHSIARNRISAVIRRKAQPHTHHHLKIRMTENDTVGIYCRQQQDE